MTHNGTPPESPYAKHAATLGALYEIPEGATTEEAVRVCSAAMRATHGRMVVVEGYMIEVSTKLDTIKFRERWWWVWPLIAGVCAAIAGAEHFLR